MSEAFIVRKGGAVSEETAAPSITVVSEDPDGVTFTLTNNDDNTAIISYDISTTQGAVELAAAATSSNITVALSVGTYTLTAFATVVGKVATQSTAAVEIVEIPSFELLYDSDVSATLPATQIDITGLSIGKDDELRLVFTSKGDSTTTNLISIYPNDLTTAANYTIQRIQAYGTSIAPNRQTTPFIMFGRSDGFKSQGFADIKVSNNDRFVYTSQFLWGHGSGSSGMEAQYINGVGTETVSSITKLSLIGSRTNGIATGSRIRLYKVNGGAA